MFCIEKKRILLTGASGGIGRALVESFVGFGAQVAISGTRVEKLESMRDEISKDLHVLPCDLSSNEDTEVLVDEACEKMGGIDALICNAGVTRDMLSLRMSDDQWDSVIQINLKSTFKLNRAAARVMMKKKYGRIVNISSVVAFTGNAGQANYCASKGGVVAMSKSFALEFAKKGITVNCVAPGFIESPMTDKLNDKQKEQIISGISMGRIGKASELCSSVIYLISDSSSYITGQTLHVNGGLLMP